MARGSSSPLARVDYDLAWRTILGIERYDLLTALQLEETFWSGEC